MVHLSLSSVGVLVVQIFFFSLCHSVTTCAWKSAKGGGCPAQELRKRRRQVEAAATQACQPPGKCQPSSRAWALTAPPGRGRNSVACFARWKAPRTARHWTLMRSPRAGAGAADESSTGRPTSLNRGRWRYMRARARKPSRTWMKNG